ncbi:MAG: sugar transferase [Saprospiraceae bacterium]|nr:sugar transferase [Saprospiraceae bacterium]
MAKRTFDIIVSLLGLIILTPVLILTALIVAFRLGRPVFFKQTRPGLNGTPFKMLKFRSMTNDRDNEGNLLPNAQRMTPFGSFLRSSSLDEIPELINVLKGDMSLVGPRPLLMDYLPFFTEEQNKRHLVKPGITGWAQVNGRNAIGWEEKLNFDVWYVNNQSFLLDLKILWMTVSKVWNREGISHEGDVAMPRFDVFIKNKNLKS